MDSQDISFIQEFAKQHPNYTSRIFEFKSIQDIAYVMQNLDAPVAASVLEKLAPKTALEIICKFKDDYQTKVLQAIKTNNLVIILRFLDTEKLRAILKKISLIRRSRIENQLKYELDEVGAWMSFNPPQVHTDLTMSEIRAYLHDDFNGSNFKEVFVVDNNNTLEGVISLNKIILANSDLCAGSLVKKVKYTLTPRMKLNIIKNHAGFGINDRLPVVSKEQKLMGVLSLLNLKKGLKHGQAIGMIGSKDMQEGYGVYGDTLLSLLNIK